MNLTCPPLATRLPSGPNSGEKLLWFCGTLWEEQPLLAFIGNLPDGEPEEDTPTANKGGHYE